MIKDLNLPVPYHPTMDIWDSSKIQAFMSCPRGFFYNYVLGWKKDEPNIHFVFGQAWHDAMEHFILNGVRGDNLRIAIEKFNATFEAEYPSVEIKDDFLAGLVGSTLSNDTHVAKNRENAIVFLTDYANQYVNDEVKYEALYTEVVATVPISSTRTFTMKLDSIVRDKDTGLIWSMEHKTTGRKTQAWMSQWFDKFQVRAYSFLLKVLYGDQFGGVIINGSVIRSKDCEHLRIPISLADEQVEDWLVQANHWLDLIEWNFEQLSRATPEDRVMGAFVPNTEACSHFGCKCDGACGLWANPLKYMNRIPAGWKVEFWNPNREFEEKVKFKINLAEGKNIVPAH